MSNKTTKILEDDTAVDVETEVVDEMETKGADEVEDVDETDEPEAEEADADESGEPEAASDTPTKRIQWARLVAFILLPALALVLAMGAGYLKWRDNSVRNSESAAQSSVQTAKDTTIALLSYTPDSVERQLGDARKLLTGEFRESYTALTNDVVIPGAQEKQISAVVSVPAAASVSATPTAAVVLVFVNQTVTVGGSEPTDTASSVRVTLEKVDNRWLISSFDPV